MRGAGLAKALLVIEAWYVSLVAVGKLYFGPLGKYISSCALWSKLVAA